MKAGKVYKIKYFNIVKNYRKKFTFIGICIRISLKHKNFIIRNIFNKENIDLIFPLDSPFIFSINELKNYNFFYKKKKLYFKKNLILKDFYNNKTFFNFSNNKKLLSPINYIFSWNEKNLKLRQIKNKFRV